MYGAKADHTRRGAKRRARPQAKRDPRLRRLGDAEAPPEPCDPGFPNCCADEVLCVTCAKAGGRVVFGLRSDGVLVARFTKRGA